jgi:flagellar hook-length control protein FliK
MSDIATLANHIVLPRVPEPAVVDQNPSAPSQDALPADSSRPLDPQQPSTGARRTDDDTAATTTGPESGTENFSDVLEKRLSQKSESRSETKGAKDPKQTGEAPPTADKPAPKQKPALLIHLANTAPGLPADPDQLKSSQTKGAPTMPSHHVTVALPGKGATKTDVKAKGNATGQTHLLSKAQPAAQGSAQGQPVQAEQLKTDTQASAKDKPIQAEQLKTDTPVADVGQTLGKNQAAKTQNGPVSNKKSANGDTQNQLPAGDTNPKKPAPDIDTQLSQTKNADILDENPKTDELLPTAKHSPADKANDAIASANPRIALRTEANRIQTAQGKNQTPAASDSAQSATQKDTSDVQAALAATRTNAVVADTDGSNPATVIVNALGTKASNVPSTLTARQPNSADNAPPVAAGPSIGGIGAAGNVQLSSAQQIIDSIRLNIDTPQQQINISLNPPELGRVRIMFQQIDGEITGLLEAQKRQTKYDIEKSIPQIVASLQECGVQVRRINVLLNEQNQQQAQFKNNDVPDGDFAGMTKHGFADKPTEENSAQPNSPQADTTRPVTQQSTNINNEITDDTINVYI